MSISPGAWPTAVTSNEDQAPSLNTSTWRMIAQKDERLRGCYVEAGRAEVSVVAD